MPTSEATALAALVGYLSGDGSGGHDEHLCGAGSVAALEKRLEEFYGVRHALCVSSATAGLLALALALELRGAQFVTTPYTYGGSVAGWLLLGNRPVFADINPLTLTLDAESAGRSVTSETKALLAVDIYGNPADGEALRRLAGERGLWYIADCAQSFGARRAGRPAGVLADACVISFTSGKTLFAGEGGAVLTDDTALYEKLVWHTQHPHRQRRDLGLALRNEFAFNARIHPLAALWADAVFDDTVARLRRHQAICRSLIDRLNDAPFTDRIDFEAGNIESSFFRLTAAWKGDAQPERLLARLRQGVPSLRIEPPPVELLYRQPAFITQFGDLIAGAPECPVAEQQALRRIALVS